MQEIWKPVKGREGYYEVSNTGKIRSLVYKDTPKGVYELKYWISPKGYCSLELSQPFFRKCLVHRLVAEAFCEKPEGCDVVNHLDNDPSNNHYTNLEWTTTSGNLVHAQKQGRLFDAQSKGGRTTGDRASKALREDTEAMVGQTYGELTVTGIGETIKYGKANRPRLIAKCSCGDIKDYDKIQLQKSKVTSCFTCAHKKMMYSRRQKQIDAMRGVVVGDFTFTGNSNNSLSTSSTTTTVELRNNITSECINKVYSYAYSKEFLKTQHKDIV